MKKPLANHSDKEIDAYLSAIASIATAGKSASEKEMEFLEAADAL